MTRSADHHRRGWCPGALRPMASGDGLIVRIRPRAASLEMDTLITLAGVASRYGNGQIDLTRRANLQLRGVTHESLPPLLDVLGERGLLDANVAAEAVRNILVNPLAGCDPNEMRDVRPLALELARLIAADRSLWKLPSKFAFLIDGGGALPLDAERADVRLRAMPPEGAQIAVGIDRPGDTRARCSTVGRNSVAYGAGARAADYGYRPIRPTSPSGSALWLGLTSHESAPAAAVRVAHAFLETRPAGGRIHDLGDSGVQAIRAAASTVLDPIGAPPLPRARTTPVGLLKHGAHVFAAGFAVPFGSIESETLLAFGEALAAAGVEEFRLSPWRTLYVPIHRGNSAEGIFGAAAALGLMVHDNDPLLKVNACPGARACCSARADTRRDARVLAAALEPYPEIRSVHVSGCPKGCARSEPADLVLVACDNGYGLVRNGTASDPPQQTIASADLTRLPALVENQTRRPRHG